MLDPVPELRPWTAAWDQEAAMALAAGFHTHIGQILGSARAVVPAAKREKKTSEVRAFLRDLSRTLLHEFGLAKAPEGDLFRDHMNAMAICYFAFIVLFVLFSIPVLAYWVNFAA
jgi:hypothetical protein